MRDAPIWLSITSSKRFVTHLIGDLTLGSWMQHSYGGATAVWCLLMKKDVQNAVVLADSSSKEESIGWNSEPDKSCLILLQHRCTLKEYCENQRWMHLQKNWSHIRSCTYRGSTLIQDFDSSHVLVFSRSNDHTWGLTKCWWGAESFVAR